MKSWVWLKLMALKRIHKIKIILPNVLSMPKSETAGNNEVHEKWKACFTNTQSKLAELTPKNDIEEVKESRLKRNGKSKKEKKSKSKNMRSNNKRKPPSSQMNLRKKNNLDITPNTASGSYKRKRGRPKKNKNLKEIIFI